MVGEGAAVLDPAGPGDRAGGQREGFHQRRLARAAVADQHHVAQRRGVVGRRCPAGGSGVCVRFVGHLSRLPVENLLDRADIRTEGGRGRANTEVTGPRTAM
ncbi:hypothetical protein SCA03_34440 [Streptomyces cacaoi]|uniref:Uncharacterized protein n=1 Tax=Streptomyces cacaoi TaxID=1898 RepID=A0A4Y3R2A8_STRCI|nr:hypothetical protein SCA03_34440 [Streptomyces cacaoi]